MFHENRIGTTAVSCVEQPLVLSFSQCVGARMGPAFGLVFKLKPDRVNRQDAMSGEEMVWYDGTGLNTRVNGCYFFKKFCRCDTTSIGRSCCTQ